jgi:hypothetical protein
VISSSSFSFGNSRQRPLRAHGHPHGRGPPPGAAGAAAASARRASRPCARPAPDVAVRPPGAEAGDLPRAATRRAARSPRAGQRQAPARGGGGAPVRRREAGEHAEASGRREHDRADHLARNVTVYQVVR